MPVFREAQRRAHVRQDVVGDEEVLTHRPAALGQQPRVHLQRKLLVKQLHALIAGVTLHIQAVLSTALSIDMPQNGREQRAFDRQFKES